MIDTKPSESEAIKDLARDRCSPLLSSLEGYEEYNEMILNLYLTGFQDAIERGFAESPQAPPKESEHVTSMALACPKVTAYGPRRGDAKEATIIVWDDPDNDPSFPAPKRDAAPVTLMAESISHTSPKESELVQITKLAKEGQTICGRIRADVKDDGYEADLRFHQIEMLVRDYTQRLTLTSESESHKMPIGNPFYDSAMKEVKRCWKRIAELEDENKKLRETCEKFKLAHNLKEPSI